MGKLKNNILFLFSCFCVSQVGIAQSKSKTDTVLFGPAIARVYDIYEINSVFFSYDTYGKGLIIKPNRLIKGKQYFKYYRIPLLLKMSAFRVDKKVRKGKILKVGQGNPFNRVDTTIYKGIELKYPLEIDGVMLKGSTLPSKETQPVIINSFQFVKECTKYPYKHFEITTKK